MLKRSAVKSFILSAIFLALVSCEGAGDCPLDVPTCCDNILFGCGTFDLPDGCSCQQYGRVAKQNLLAMQSVIKAKPDAPSSTSGTWSGTLSRETSSCLLAPKQVQGLIKIYESKGAVRIVVPAYGTLSGKSKRNGFDAQGVYSIPLTRCSAKIKANFSRTTAARGVLQTRVDYSCGGGAYLCSASYRGSISKTR